jgi:hypothetical protein
MTWLDVLLQRWRIRKARPHIPPDARVLDVGTFDGRLFRAAALSGVGIDPELREGVRAPKGVVLVRGLFPDDLADEPEGAFGAVAALAVMEHVPEDDLARWSDALAHLVRSDGVVVITVPAPAVDQILHVLMRLRLVQGIEAHQHHGFQPDDVVPLFGAPRWVLVERRRFQLGLNNLFVFRRTSSA